jgi:phenylacetyl-CoA:acceptor oxidoreductase subunit 2
MSFGPNPWQQQNWDWRAASNFMAGGAGSGLIVFAAVSRSAPWLFVAGAAMVALGLFAVALELGRPWRAANVVRHPQRSWMSREALIAPLLLGSALAAALGVPGTGPLAALLALGFVYCQAHILQAAKGIPAWREPRLVPLLIATGLAEGTGAGLLLRAPTDAAPAALWFGFALLLLARLALWPGWRQRVRSAAAALAQIDAAGTWFKLCTLLPLAAALIAVSSPLSEGGLRALQAVAGALALGGGLWFKLRLVTRGAFNQGFALVHLPVRGVPHRQEN